MIVTDDGRPRSVYTDKDRDKEIEWIISSLTEKERECLMAVLADPSLLKQIMREDYERDPVGPRQFITDDFYLGVTGSKMWPRLKDDFVELFEGGYSAAALGGSLGLDSIVIGADGSLRTLGERVGQVERVLTAQDDGTIVPSEADSSVVSGVKEVVVLTLANGMRLTLTPDHGVRVFSEGGWYDWKRAGDLVVGDLVVVMRRYATEPSSDLGEDAACLIAYWLANGSASKTRARYNSGNIKTSEEVLVLLRRFGFDGSLYRKGNAWEVHTLRTKTSGFWDWALRYGLNAHSHDVVIPDEVCRAKNQVVAVFLNRLWACEGTVYASTGSGRRSPPRFNLAMTSERFIRQVQLLLFRFGVASRIYRVEHKDKRRGGKVSVCWHVVVSGVGNLSRFLDTVGVILGKEDACERIASYCLTKSENTNVDLLPITWGWLNDCMVNEGIRRPRDSEWWKLGRDRLCRVSRSMFKAWISDFGMTELGCRLSGLFGEDVGFEAVKSVDSIGVHVETGDVTNVRMGTRFIANGISVRNSIGWGKTFFATCGILYIVYQMSCLKDPQAVYGLAPGSQIELILVSITNQVVRRRLIPEVRSKMDASPYFREYLNFEVAQSIMEIRLPAKNILIVGGSSQSVSIGGNVFGGLIDEISFMDESKGYDSKGKAVSLDRGEGVAGSVIRRMKSRFLKAGKLPGILFQVSSKERPVAYIEKLIEHAKETSDPTVFIREYNTMDVKPVEMFSAKKFKVAVGNERIRPMLDPTSDQEKMYRDAGLRVLEIPEDFRSDFERDLEGSLREVAGVATESISPYIQRTDKIFGAQDRGREKGLISPLDEDEWVANEPLKYFWERIARREVVKLKGGGEETIWIPIRHPDARRHAHIDLAVSGDAAGIVIGHASTWVDVKRRDKANNEYTDIAPVIEVDLALRIIPPPGDEIDFGSVREIVYQFAEHGFLFRRVTFDSYQSVEPRQQFRQKGIESEVQSMDATTAPYDTTKDALYEGRLWLCSPCDAVVEELVDLRRTIVKRANGLAVKVDHPARSRHGGKGRKDVSDALAGVVYSISGLEHGDVVPIMRGGESVKSEGEPMTISSLVPKKIDPSTRKIARMPFDR